jgi:hypothetical protein
VSRRPTLMMRNGPLIGFLLFPVTRCLLIPRKNQSHSFTFMKSMKTCTMHSPNSVMREISGYIFFLATRVSCAGSQASDRLLISFNEIGTIFGMSETVIAKYSQQAQTDREKVGQAVCINETIYQHLHKCSFQRPQEYIGCPTSGVAQRAMREAAPHARCVSKATQGNSKKVACIKNPINCLKALPCPGFQEERR